MLTARLAAQIAACKIKFDFYAKPLCAVRARDMSARDMRASRAQTGVTLFLRQVVLRSAGTQAPNPRPSYFPLDPALSNASCSLFDSSPFALSPLLALPAAAFSPLLRQHFRSPLGIGPCARALLLVSWQHVALRTQHDSMAAASCSSTGGRRPSAQRCA